MNISPWVKAELIIDRAMESHRKFQSERDEKKTQTTFIICKRKLQVDPRPGHTQEATSGSLLNEIPQNNCATSVWLRFSTPLNTEKLAAGAKLPGAITVLLPAFLNQKVKKPLPIGLLRTVRNCHFSFLKTQS